jgi:hypothetical protein
MGVRTEIGCDSQSMIYHLNEAVIDIKKCHIKCFDVVE